MKLTLTEATLIERRDSYFKKIKDSYNAFNLNLVSIF